MAEQREDKEAGAIQRQGGQDSRASGCHRRGRAAQDEPGDPNYNDKETDLRDPRSGTRVGAEVSSLQLLSELPTRSVFRRGVGVRRSENSKAETHQC